MMKKNTIKCHSGKTKFPTLHYSLILTLVLKTICISCLILGSVSSYAQTYPFTLPTSVSATFNVTTTTPEKANFKLLGFNYWDFKTDNDKLVADALAPVSARWSEGNFYNWETDAFQNDSYDNFEYDIILSQSVSSGIKWGYPYMLDYYKKDQGEKGGLGMEVLFNFSVGFTSVESNLQRLSKYLNDGIEINDIEIGNEYFWKIFRNNATAEAPQQAALFKAHADALRAAKPDVKISIPLGWRTSQAGYNSTIMGNKTYFDAISVHKYVGADPDAPGESDIAYASLLTARLGLIKDVDPVRAQIPGKPVWLTEWNVDGGASGEWAAALGATDIYMYLFSNQDKYHRACWFSAASAKNPLVLMSVEDKYSPKFPLEKTISGAMFEIVRSVFKDADLYNGSMTTTKLTTSLGSVDAVNAMAVTKFGKTRVFAVNLTDKDVEFDLNIDGSTYQGTFKHEAMYGRAMDNSQTMAMAANPLALVKSGSGTITLPPLSINVIGLDNTKADNPIPSVVVNTPVFNSSYLLGKDIPLKATATDMDGTISKIQININDALYAESLTANYDGTFTPTEVGTYKISAITFDNDNNQKEAYTIVNVLNQGPYKGASITIPGSFEAEDYDIGGEGISYHDNSTNNKFGNYRADETVDIGTIGTDGFCIAETYPGEWMEYTIEVEEDGLYDMEVTYASKLTTGVLGAEFADEGIALFNDLATPQTSASNWTTYMPVTKSGISLTKGKHVLRINVVARGYNLDKFTFTKTASTSVRDLNQNSLAVHPNPSASGRFYLSENLQWEVYSLGGSLVTKGEGTMVDLSIFNKGMYILKVEGTVVKLIYR